MGKGEFTDWTYLVVKRLGSFYTMAFNFLTIIIQLFRSIEYVNEVQR